VADDRLRELERRWRESGTPADELAWLRAALRAGSLERRRLELAAFLGHDTARAALELQPHEDPPLGFPLYRYQGRLRTTLDPQEAIRVGIAAARASEHGEQAALDLLERAERWVVDPSREANAALRLPPALHRAVEELSHLSHVVRAAVHAFQAVACLSSPDWGGDGAVDQGVKAVLAMASAVDEEVVIEAIRADVVPWLLGQRDPVRDRVAQP
jgi:hypothetical protein